MLRVIVSENISKCFVRLDKNTMNLVLQGDLSRATFFTDEFLSELYCILKRARKSFKGYRFRVVKIDDALVNPSMVLNKHLSAEYFV